jgi:hypothetical protein
MCTRVVKWLCLSALFVAFILWQWIANYEFPLQVAVSLGAAVVAVQAFHSGWNRWTMCFISISLLFIPANPDLPLANRLHLLAIVLTAAAFAVSLIKLESQPLLSIPSITDRNPGSESL